MVKKAAAPLNARQRKPRALGATVVSAFAAIAALTSCGSPPSSAPQTARGAHPPAPPPPRPAASEPKSAERSLEIRIAPESDAGEITALNVTLRFSAAASDFGDQPPLFRIPEVEQGEPGIAERIEDVTAQDDDGALALTKGSGEDDGQKVAEWKGARRARGPITLSYRVRALRAAPDQVMGVRSHAGGFSGTGWSFLLLTRAKEPHRVRIRWDRSKLGQGNEALSSFGAGNVDVMAPLDDVLKAVFLAGRVGRIAIDDGFHFEGAWLGKPDLEPFEALPFAARFYKFEREFFKDDAPSSFSVFVRVTPPIKRSWIAFGHLNGIMVLAGEGLGFTRAARFMLAHEMTHRWIGIGMRLGGPAGSAYWFTEGFTVHYTGKLLLRAGLATPTDFLEDLNERTERFWTSPVQKAPNTEITERFWQSRDYEKLPYDRGLLYAAEVDAAIRAKSSGRQSLDDLMLDLVAKSRAAGAADKREFGELSASAFREAVGRELGAEGESRYDAVVLEGKLPSAPPDAFGPCFKSMKTKLYKFDLGVDFQTLVKEKRIAKLKSGSEAARAGLKEGERVANMSFAPGNVHVPIELTLERSGKKETIKYFARGDAVDGIRWDRAPQIPDSTCSR